MTTCPRNLPQHFNGCACVANGSTTGEATDVSLTPQSRRSSRPQRLMLNGKKAVEVSRDTAAGVLRPREEFFRDFPDGNGGWSNGDLVTIASEWSKDDCIPFTVGDDVENVQTSRIYPETRFAFDGDNNLVVFNDTAPSQRFRRPLPGWKSETKPRWKFWSR